MFIQKTEDGRLNVDVFYAIKMLTTLKYVAIFWTHV